MSSHEDDRADASTIDVSSEKTEAASKESTFVSWGFGLICLSVVVGFLKASEFSGQFWFAQGVGGVIGVLLFGSIIGFVVAKVFMRRKEGAVLFMIGVFSAIISVLSWLGSLAR